MSSRSKISCSLCGSEHEKQVFISHPQKDKELAEKVRRACCEVKVASYLLEFSPRSETQTPPAEVIAEEVAIPPEGSCIPQTPRNPNQKSAKHLLVRR